MIRGAILVIVGISVAMIAWPFFASWQALNTRGIILQGRVHHKDETVRVDYSTWQRTRDVTVEFPVPETRGVSYFDIHPDVQQYDELRVGQAVEVRYLLLRDLPAAPMSAALRDMHALPMVRVVNVRDGNRLETTFTPEVVALCVVFGACALLLVLWRITRLKLFAWLIPVGFLAGLPLILAQEFPRPVPRPVLQIRHGTARVKTVGTIERLFSGPHERGIPADVPVQVAALEFVPEGHAEPVVAVDLIDGGTGVPLKDQMVVPIEYEAGNPRKAYIEGATRTFGRRNSSGLILLALVGVAAVAAWLIVTPIIGRAYKRLLSRGSQSG